VAIGEGIAPPPLRHNIARDIDLTRFASTPANTYPDESHTLDAFYVAVENKRILDELDEKERQLQEIKKLQTAS